MQHFVVVKRGSKEKWQKEKQRHIFLRWIKLQLIGRKIRTGSMLVQKTLEKGIIMAMQKELILSPKAFQKRRMRPGSMAISLE